MIPLLAALPAWAQVVIALAVPLNTLIITAGAIALQRMGKKVEKGSQHARRRQRLQAMRIGELEEELRRRRNGRG